MKLKNYLTVAFIISVISLFCFACVALLLSSHQITQFDRNTIGSIQGLESPLLTSIMKIFTYIGSGTFIAILSIIVLFFLFKRTGQRSELYLFIATILGSNILFSVLKMFFHRARPDLHRLIEISGYSFPSGHATMAMTVYGILSFLLWRHITTKIGRTILIISSSIMILMIGVSRIYLGVHYPSDVIAGYFTGGFWISVAIWYYQRYQEKKYEARKV